MRRRHGLTPLQVLERQHGFLLRHDTNADFATYVARCFSSEQAWARDDQREGVGRAYRDKLLEQIRLADAYRVTAEMCDLLMFAASRLDATDKVDRTLAPSPWGFVAFEKPLPFKDVRGLTMLIQYMTWGPATGQAYRALTGEAVQESGIWHTMWNDMIDHPDDVAKGADPRMVRLVGRYGFIGSGTMIDGAMLGTEEFTLSEEQKALARIEDAKAIEMGMTPLPLVGEYTNPDRFLHALWLLLGQTITDVREDVMPRAAQKMVGRMQIPGRVTVISLRRRAGRPSDGESQVQWQHRWMVKGHWRWQPYGDGSVQRIWIAPYVKGPEDKPFVQSEKVYSLDR